MSAVKIDKIRGLATKASPLSSDSVIIADSEDNNKLKSVLISDLPSSGVPAGASSIAKFKRFGVQVISDNTTWQVDSDLSVSLDEDSYYTLEMHLIFQNAIGGGAHAVSISSSQTNVFPLLVIMSSSGTGSSLTQIEVTNTNMTSTLNTGSIAAGGKTLVLIRGTVYTQTGTPGTFALKWRPKDNTTDAMTLLKGSYIKLIKET